MTNPAIAPGDTAPDFTLADQHGAPFTLSQARGAPVVLFFYPQDDTEGCTRENLEFSKLAPDFAAFGTHVLGISPDDADCHARFAEKFSLPTRLLADPDRVAIEAYGLWREKRLYGRAYVGLVRTTVLIDVRGVVEEVWTVNRIRGHAARVLEAVGKLPPA